MSTPTLPAAEAPVTIKAQVYEKIDDAVKARKTRKEHDFYLLNSSQGRLYALAPSIYQARQAVLDYYGIMAIKLDTNAVLDEMTESLFDADQA